VRRFLTVIGSVLALLLLPQAAQAKNFWGVTCFRQPGNEGHHCYAIANWAMAGYPREYTDGTALYMDSLSTDVPGWESGDFITNEVWNIFGANDYLETGQIAGMGKSCCTLHRFWSYTLHGAQYTQIDVPAAAGNTYNTYEIYDPCHCGNWQYWWNGSPPYGNGTKVLELNESQTSYPAWTKTLEDGLEAGANYQPYSWGRTEVAGVVPPSDVWTEWISGFGVHAIEEASPHQCVGRNAYSPYYGNIEFSTCKIEE
jgi:hypothetical protein